jgi:hypothetical protein
MPLCPVARLVVVRNTYSVDFLDLRHSKFGLRPSASFPNRGSASERVERDRISPIHPNVARLGADPANRPRRGDQPTSAPVADLRRTRPRQVAHRRGASGASPCRAAYSPPLSGSRVARHEPPNSVESVRRLCVMGTAGQHHPRLVRGFRARSVHYRRQGVGERGDRPVSRASRCRSLYHALPMARAATGASAELDPATWRDFRL